MDELEDKVTLEGQGLEALRALKIVRERSHQWIDDSKTESGIEGAGFIKTCEALECFFTPIDIYPEALGKEYVLDADVLKEDLTYIMKTIEKEGWPPSPYFDPHTFSEEGKFQKGKTDFTDAVSFALTTLIDGYLYINKFYSNEDIFDSAFKENLLRYAKESLDWLVENVYFEKDEGGAECAYYSGLGSKNWPEGIKFKGASIYFTYTSVIALAYAVKFRNELGLSDEYVDKLHRILSALRYWLFSTTMSIKGKFTVYYDTLSMNESFEKPQILFVYIMLSDFAFTMDAGLKSKNEEEYTEKIQNMIKTLNAVYNSDDRLDLISGGSHKVRIRSDDKPLDYSDRYLSFLMLEAFVYAYRVVKSIKGEKELLEEIYKTIEDLHRNLLDNANAVFELTGYGEVKGLWGQERVFMIYVNERAIESLTEYGKFSAEMETFISLTGLSREQFRSIIFQGVRRSLESWAILNQITNDVLATFDKYEKKAINGDGMKKNINEDKLAEEVAQQIDKSVRKDGDR